MRASLGGSGEGTADSRPGSGVLPGEAALDAAPEAQEPAGSRPCVGTSAV